MRKTLSILLALIMAISSFAATTTTAFADEEDETYCGCCDDCINEEGCSCDCGNCSYDDGEGEGEGEGDTEEGEGDENAENPADVFAKYEGTDPKEADDKYTDDDRKIDRSHLLSYQYCGDSMFWYIRNNTLYIFGTGRMYDYSATKAPWSDKSFDSVIIRPEVEGIGKSAFAGRDITSVKIPSTVQKIGNNAFDGCTELTSVSFGKDMQSVGNSAFNGCTNLKSIKLNNNLQAIGINCFYNCTSLVKVRFPSTLSVIPANAFANCKSLSYVVLRTGLVRIDSSAFNGCAALSKIMFPDTLTEIGASAFKDCSKLASLEPAGALNTIGASAFENCTSLKAIDLKQATTVSLYAFKNSGVTTATLPASLQTFDVNMFYNCTNVEVHVKRNPNLYKKLMGKSNLNVVCIEHDNQKLELSKATFLTNGIADGYVCRACGENTKVKIVNSIASISLSKTEYTYNGKVQTPTVKVKDTANKTISASNYTTQYASGRTAVGKYAVKTTMCGNYSGQKTLYFVINPAGTSISSLTATSKGFKVAIKKQATQTTGYQIRYSTKANMSGAKTVTISKSSTTSKAISKLSAKKKYYVQVRTYKTVSKVNYYSSWSSAKSVTTKK